MSTGRPGKSIVMIGNSHIDPVWLWKSDEGFQEVKSTFRSALERMREFPGFVFTAGSACFYSWIEENLPELFAGIREAVASGGWSVTGGWWVEPDCNLPSGEAFIRQALYGMRYFREKFGVVPIAGYNPDSFGHNAMLPQLLLKAGLRAYAVMRPHGALLELPSPLFRWRAPDGSEVICLRMEGEYTAWTKAGIRKNVDLTLGAMERSQVESLPAFYGVGNHGGGPTIENIKAVLELSEEDGRVGIRFGSLEDYFASLDASGLPIYEGGLEKIFPGCYSADSEVKETNRYAEAAVRRAETLSSLALLATRRPYPAAELTQIWKRILFNQFHDTLAGTSREDARDEAVAGFHEAIMRSRALSSAAVQCLAERIDTRGEGEPLILFNTEAVAFDGMFEADIPWVRRKPVRLKAPDGTEILYQEGSYGLTAPEARKLLVFHAAVPPMGYAVYRLYVENPLVKAEYARHAAGPAGEGTVSFSNDRFSLLFGDGTGTPASLRLPHGTVEAGTAGEARNTGPVQPRARIPGNEDSIELLSSPLEFKVYEDVRDTWGAEGDWKRCLGGFAREDFRIVEDGPLRTVFRGTYTYGRSRLVVHYRMYAEEAFFDLDCSLFNAEKHVQVVLSIRPSFPSWNVTAAIPCGIERRDEVEGENFAHGWTDLSPDSGLTPDDSPGLRIFTAVRYGYRVLSGEYQLILARSTVFARGSGSPLEPGAEYRCADMGDLWCTVRLFPRSGRLPNRDARVSSEGMILKPAYLLDCRHAGEETASRKSSLQLESENVFLSAFKAAEDGGGTVLRLVETEGIASKAVLAVAGRRHSLAFTPFEIKTVRFDQASGEFTETNLLEEPAGTESGAKGSTRTKKTTEKAE